MLFVSLDASRSLLYSMWQQQHIQSGRQQGSVIGWRCISFPVVPFPLHTRESVWITPKEHSRAGIISAPKWDFDMKLCQLEQLLLEIFDVQSRRDSVGLVFLHTAALWLKCLVQVQGSLGSKVDQGSISNATLFSILCTTFDLDQNPKQCTIYRVPFETTEGQGGREGGMAGMKSNNPII